MSLLWGLYRLEAKITVDFAKIISAIWFIFKAWNFRYKAIQIFQSLCPLELQTSFSYRITFHVNQEFIESPKYLCGVHQGNFYHTDDIETLASDESFLAGWMPAYKPTEQFNVWLNILNDLSI